MFINRLPPEILGDIFLQAGIPRFACEGRENYIRRITHDWAPLNIVHVCRYWRAVALSMQILWTSFEVENIKPELLAYWSSFARSSPLNLGYSLADDLRHSEPVGARTIKRTEKMLHQISLCAERWGSLRFRIDHPELTEALQTMLQNASPPSTLRSFEILLYLETTPKDLDAFALAISSFLSLRRLALTFFSLKTQLYLPRILPWRALEDVYIHASITVEDFIWCLIQCTSARKVFFRYRGVGRKQQPPTTNVNIIRYTRPKLKSLTLSECCDPYRFLQHFILPSLVSLVIESAHGPSDRLQEFLYMSHPPLQNFTLEVGLMKKEDVFGCLLTPYLRSVPNVDAMSPWNSNKPCLADIVRWRPDILKEFPELKAWSDKIGYHVGWRTNSRDVGTYYYYY